jgi:hypothetical protein
MQMQTKIGPARAERLARTMYPDADAVRYIHKIRSGEVVAVTLGSLVRIVRLANLDGESPDAGIDFKKSQAKKKSRG